MGEEFGAFISIYNGCILIDLISPPLGYQAVMNIDEGNTYLHPNYHVDLCPTFLSPSQPARFHLVTQNSKFADMLIAGCSLLPTFETTCWTNQQQAAPSFVTGSFSSPRLLILARGGRCDSAYRGGWSKEGEEVLKQTPMPCSGDTSQKDWTQPASLVFAIAVRCLVDAARRRDEVGVACGHANRGCVLYRSGPRSLCRPFMP